MINSVHTGKMALAVWETKLATLFKRFDKGDKGRVTKDDIETKVNAFKTIGYLTQGEEQEMREMFKELWNIFFNGRTSVTLEEWVEGHRILLSHDKAQISPLEVALKRASTIMFKAADKQRTGKLSAEGYAVFLACLGFDDTEYAHSIFKRLDSSGKGEITEEEFSNAFHEFNFNVQDEPSKEFMGPLIC